MYSILQVQVPSSHEMVPMKRGAFFAHAIINTITPQKFIPVFLVWSRAMWQTYAVSPNTVVWYTQ